MSCGRLSRAPEAPTARFDAARKESNAVFVQPLSIKERKAREQNKKPVVEPVDPKEEQWQALLKEKNISITEVVMSLKDLPIIKWGSYLEDKLEVPFELLQTALKFCSREARAQGFLS